MVSLCCPMAGDPGLPFWASLVRSEQIRALRELSGTNQSPT